MPKYEWTEDDEFYLERYLFDEEERDRTYTDPANLLGISPRQVTRKASKMRSKGESLEYLFRPWSEKDKQYVIDNYKSLSTKDMSEHLNRTRESIIAKANELGVYKLDKISNFDKEIRWLASIGIWKAEIARILGLKPKSVGDYINRNNIKCRRAPREASSEVFRNEEKIMWDEYYSKLK